MRAHLRRSLLRSGLHCAVLGSGEESNPAPKKLELGFQRRNLGLKLRHQTVRRSSGAQGTKLMARSRASRSHLITSLANAAFAWGYQAPRRRRAERAANATTVARC
jgi:hypothetical protein